LEPTQLLGLLGPLQLSGQVAVLRTVARIDRQTAVRPQLPLGAEPMRGLDQRDQQIGPNRTDGRKQFRGATFSPLRIRGFLECNGNVELWEQRVSVAHVCVIF
jgi:hypothetical protein